VISLFCILHSERYQQITSLLPAAKAVKTRKPKTKPAQAEA
jgi:hypothetical protein